MERVETVEMGVVEVPVNSNQEEGGEHTEKGKKERDWVVVIVGVAGVAAVVVVAAVAAVVEGVAKTERKKTTKTRVVAVEDNHRCTKEEDRMTWNTIMLRLMMVVRVVVN